MSVSGKPGESTGEVTGAEDEAESGPRDGAVTRNESGDRAEALSRARARARRAKVFGSMYPGQGSAPASGGFDARHYEEGRPPHHGG